MADESLVAVGGVGNKQRRANRIRGPEDGRDRELEDYRGRASESELEAGDQAINGASGEI